MLTTLPLLICASLYGNNFSSGLRIRDLYGLIRDLQWLKMHKRVLYPYLSRLFIVSKALLRVFARVNHLIFSLARIRLLIIIVE